MSVQGLLRKYRLRPRKGLGQNFLADSYHLSKIVEAAELDPADTVLEIGPGLGTLTRRLAGQVPSGRVVAVEVDPNMVRALQMELADLSNLTLVEADILGVDPPQLVRGGPYVVVANLPYYITSAVLRHLLESEPRPQRLVFTVQQEVGQRLVAGPGQMSLLAVSAQFYGKPRLVHKIPAGAFIPPPKVDSAVVRVDTFPTPPFAGDRPALFFRVVKAGFSQKRKQLKNSLAASLGLPAGDVAGLMAEAGIDPRRRAQTLSLAEWAGLVDRLEGII
ncbi:MAG: 16S rRNA (adenine(1518)-N(6)/adenine(1519)-N(6))-dimethyltransferase RsmA [Anaerolineae bacterium]